MIWLLAIATGAAAFAYAKKQQASNGAAGAAGAATAVGTGLVVSTLWYLFPILLIGGAGFYLGRKSSERKALPPGPS
ncbi:MAG: hypothetical protein H6713_18030 [Myxococcales bacterium]|nr:hypothetical protein [Myxococcales bacterium]MCB9751876.1 hypothetical protein [Myxococcales bacterium]